MIYKYLCKNNNNYLLIPIRRFYNKFICTMRIIWVILKYCLIYYTIFYSRDTISTFCGLYTFSFGYSDRTACCYTFKTKTNERWKELAEPKCTSPSAGINPRKKSVSTIAGTVHFMTLAIAFDLKGSCSFHFRRKSRKKINLGEWQLSSVRIFFFYF